MKGSDLGIVVLVLLILLLATWLQGCASLQYQDPATGQVIEVRLGVKGCVSLHREAKTGDITLVVEHDGMSGAFAGTIRAVVGSIGTVFGGERDQPANPVAGEGCAPSGSAAATESRRVLGELVEPPSPRETFP